MRPISCASPIACPSVIALLFLAALLSYATFGPPHAMLAQSHPPARGTDDLPPLLQAAASGRIDEVRRLLQTGADANEKLNGIGLTALMLAAGRGDVQIVKILLQAGANPNAAGGVAHVGFFTPLNMAMNPQTKNRFEVIDALIAGGAQLNPPPSFPESPLDAAVVHGDIEMIKFLLKRGSDVNWEDEVGHTALVTAISMGDRNVAVVKLLLDSGADPNKPRLLSGYDCHSHLKSLNESRRVSRDKVTEEIRRLIIRAGGKSRSRRSHGDLCKPW